MTQNLAFRAVEKATVKLPEKGGQGVLVTGGVIMTAAHCIDCTCDGSMVLGDYFIIEIETTSQNLKVQPLAVEPISDIAILGSLDDQVFPEEDDKFMEFCRVTDPVPLYLKEFRPKQKMGIHIYTHEGTWVAGTVTAMKKDANKLCLEADDIIKGGTSGGPIVNDSGELVAVASLVSESNGDTKSSGMVPCPYLALPLWISHEYFGLSMCP